MSGGDVVGRSRTRGPLALVLVVSLVVGAYLLGAAGSLGSLGALFGDGAYERNGDVVVTGIRSLRELTTVEAVEYVLVEAGDDRGLLDFALGDRLQLLAVAEVRAGVDLALVGSDDVEIDEDRDAVAVTLPPSVIQSVALDNDATQVFDRETGLLTRGDAQLETRARQAAEELLRGQAREAGLLERADDEARAAVVELLTALGFAEVEVRTGE